MALMGLVQAFSPIIHNSAFSKPGDTYARLPSTHPSFLVSSQHKPWGDFEFQELSLEQPRDFLHDTGEPLGAPRWFFGTDSRKQVEELFSTSELTIEQKAKL